MSTNNTQEFIDALKEQPKVDFIKSLITQFAPGLSPADAAKLGHLLITKDFDADVQQDNLTALDLRTHGISYTPADPNAADENLKHDHIAIAVDIVDETNQALNPDPNITAHDRRLITIKNAFAMEIALKDFVEQTYMQKPTNGQIVLEGDAPKVTMGVDQPGVGANMSVVDKSTGHVVASMQWTKSLQQFDLNLFDKDTGSAKNSFSMHEDGKVYINGKEVITSDTGMQFKGAVTSLDAITELGVYEGVDVPDAPVQGKFIVTVVKDNEGNFAYTFVDDKMDTHLGGKPAGQPNVTWKNKVPNHLSGSADPVDTLGNDHDLYFKIG